MKTQGNGFHMNTTIRQKRRAYIQSSAVLITMAGILAYFAANLFSVYAGRHTSFSRFETWLTTRPLAETVFAAPRVSSFIVAFLAVAVVALLAVRGYTRITDDITKEAGTAQWGSLKWFNRRFSRSGNPKKPDDFKDMILSEHTRMSTDIYYHQTALNMVLLGATRSGKSRFYVKPNLLQMNCNYVVTDPKGELLESVGPALEAFGYNVRVFDIFDKEKCNTYNPFRYITCEEEVATLAQQLMDAAKPGGEEGGKSAGESPFWDLSSLSLLRACIYLLWKYGEDEEIMGGRTYIPCFASVNMLLALAMEREGKAGQNATLEGSYLDEMFERVKQRSRGSMPYCCISWDQIKGNPLNPTGATIIANTTARLNMFSIDRIRDLTSSDDIDLNAFGERKDAIFLIMNPKDRTFNFLLNMLYSQLFISLYKRGRRLHGCKYARLRNGDFVRFYRPNAGESGEEFDNRIRGDIEAMCSPVIKKHAHYFDILDANGEKISARPTMELAKQYCCELAHMKVEKLSGTMFPFHNRFILDEFFNIGKIPDFLTVLSTIAGYNASCDVILQDIGQIKSMYDKDWSSVFGNCPVNLVLKVADNETAKYVSESLGKATVAHAQERATQTNLKSGTDYNIDVKQRDLMTMDEVKALDNSQEIIIVSGMNPLLDTKHPYTTHKHYQYTSDATGIPFDRSRFAIRPARLVREVERPGIAPKVEVLTAERIFRLFQAELRSVEGDGDYSGFDDEEYYEF